MERRTAPRPGWLGWAARFVNPRSKAAAACLAASWLSRMSGVAAMMRAADTPVRRSLDESGCVLNSSASQSVSLSSSQCPMRRTLRAMRPFSGGESLRSPPPDSSSCAVRFSVAPEGT